MSLEKVKERLRMKFERLCSLNSKSEKAFISMGKFKGNCTYCGIYGHKAKDFKKRASLKKNNGVGGQNSSSSTSNSSGIAASIGRFHQEITCYKCQKKGHIARYCPLMKKNESNSA